MYSAIRSRRQTADRGLASESCVAAVSVVVVEPGCKGGGAFVVAGEDVAVGPFGLEGPVEALDLPVLPGTVRSDQEVLDAGDVKKISERDTVGVVPRVVGHDRFDVDADVIELFECSCEELDRRRGFLVGKDLRIREPAVVIDDRVHLVEPDPGLLLHPR